MSEQLQVNGKIKFRRDTTENWELNKNNFIPEEGEPCFDITLNKIKVGNGINTYGELKYLSEDEINQLAERLGDLETLVGDESVSDQIQNALNKIDMSDICKINSIYVGDTLLDIVDKSVVIPIATRNNLGVVRGSDEILINSEGNMNVGTISIDKITQGSQTIIFDNGNSKNY